MGWLPRTWHQSEKKVKAATTLRRPVKISQSRNSPRPPNETCGADATSGKAISRSALPCTGGAQRVSGAFVNPLVQCRSWFDHVGRTTVAGDLAAGV